jgi:hypothetical protein
MLGILETMLFGNTHDYQLKKLYTNTKTKPHNIRDVSVEISFMTPQDV